MKAKAVLLVVSLLATLAMADVGRAEVFWAVADTFVDESHPDRAYGRRDFLRTDGDHTVTRSRDTYYKVMLLRFPREAVTADPVWLCLDVASGPARLRAYPVDEPWDEATVTWNTRPASVVVPEIQDQVYDLQRKAISYGAMLLLEDKRLRGKWRLSTRPHRSCYYLLRLPESLALVSVATPRATRYYANRAFVVTGRGPSEPPTVSLLHPTTGLLIEPSASGWPIPDPRSGYRNTLDPQTGLPLDFLREAFPELTSS